MNPPVETIGDRVKKAREVRGLTQQQVTERGGPSKATLFRIESDLRYSAEGYLRGCSSGLAEAQARLAKKLGRDPGSPVVPRLKRKAS